MNTRDVLMLVLALALGVAVVTGYIDRRHAYNHLRGYQIASCERDNVIRANQRLELDVLLVAVDRFQVTDPDPAVRLFLRTQRPVLQAARDRVQIIDCEHPPQKEEQ